MIEGVVKTAFALTPDEKASLEAHMAGLLGTQVSLAEKIDKTLIAGIEVEVGGRVLDNSIKGRLHEVRRQLVKRG